MKPPNRKSLIGLGCLLTGLAIVTFSPLGLWVGFPPARWWGSLLNRREFSRHEDRYRAIAAAISREMADSKPGDHRFYETDDSRKPSSLKALNSPETDVVPRLRRDGRLVEAIRFGKDLAVIFATQSTSGGGFYLVSWQPSVSSDSLWAPPFWWENEHIDVLDPLWWSTYSRYDWEW